jgi:hypothetical protein
VSVEVLLVPAAMAAFAAWKAGREVGTVTAVEVQTRLRDRELLVRSLRDLGAEVTVDEGGVRAESGPLQLLFTVNDEGIAVAHVEAGDPDQVTQVIHSLDEQYTAHVQVALYERVKARAARMGLSIESEQVDENNALTLVLAVDEAEA